MKKPIIFLFLILTVAMTSCKENNSAGDNPFLQTWDTPFGVPPFGDIKPEHYKPAYEEAMKQHIAEIEAITGNTDAPSFDNVIIPLDRAGSMLAKVEGVFGLVNGADSNDELKAVEKEMTPLLSAHRDMVNLDPLLFEKVKAVYDNMEAAGLDSLQMRLLEKTYLGFLRSGAGLAEAEKEALRKINGELAMAQVQFGSNLQQAIKSFSMVVEEADLTGLPQNLKTAASELAKKMGQEGKYAFNLDKASMLPFLTYSDRRDLREKLYRGYLERCNHGDSIDNKDVINEIVRLRTERARILGYNNFADYQLELRMAKTIPNVYSLLDELWAPGLEGAKRELEDMRMIKLAETGNGDFESWDWWYYAEKLRQQKYDLNEEELRPYFSLDNVQAGIFDLSNRLFGITFRPVSVPVYNTECRTFEVLDVDNTHLGILMMDFFPRDGKRVGAWCGSFQRREFENGTKVKDPIIYVVCNFTRPVGSAPSLLSLEEAETFFHEFGHALHNFFIQAPYKGVYRAEQDFMELPSQIMENWAFEPAMLRKYATHYTSNNPIPDDLIRKIENSAHFNQGFMLLENIAACYLDMDIHTIDNYTSLNINEFENKALAIDRGMIPQVAPRYRYPYFNHIFASAGYAAGYYGYKWAEVLDKDAYAAFVETGDLFNKEVADRFRREILSKGGMADGMTLYRNFRGSDPSRDHLLYASGLKEKPAQEKPLLLETVDAMDE